MKYFSMFSGIGGFELGFPAEWECVGYSEVDKYAKSIYRKQFPEHKGFGDAKTIDIRELPEFDLLCAGFPCQSFSVAGQRRGFGDSRGNLFFEIARIADARRPRYLLLENVPGLLSHEKGTTFETVIGTLDEIGYLGEWDCLNTRWFLPQNRQRVFIIGHLGKFGGRKIFPIRESEELIEEKNEGKSENEPRVCGAIDSRCGALRNAGENYIIHTNKSGTTTPHDESQALRSGASHNYMTVMRTLRGEGLRSAINTSVTVSHALRSAEHNTTKDVTLIINRLNRIRRLTPVECERLQGFPDNWTESGIDENGAEIRISDTQRYKCLGNAVSVPVIKFIADEIERQMTG